MKFIFGVASLVLFVSFFVPIAGTMVLDLIQQTRIGRRFQGGKWFCVSCAQARYGPHWRREAPRDDQQEWGSEDFGDITLLGSVVSGFGSIAGVLFSPWSWLMAQAAKVSR